MPPPTEADQDSGAAGDASSEPASIIDAGDDSGNGRFGLGVTLGVFLSVYLLGMFHRTALGVAGLEARERFGISPFQLSLFVLLQIGIYAGMQIPAGILVDRFGTKRLLLVACTLMASSSAVFAVVPNYPGALAARAVLGVGDAMVFVSILRYASIHVTPRRYPLVVALTATLGAVGNIASALPLSLLLQGVGWAPTFLVAAALTAIDGVLVLIVAPSHDSGPRIKRTRKQIVQALGRVRRSVAGAWAVSGTKLGFWVHFSCTCTMAFLSVLWGVPFLVQAQGFSQEAAATVLSLNVIVQVSFTPVIGTLIARRPQVRVPVALSVACLTIVLWALVILVGGGATPDWVLVVMFAFTAIGGPASMIGFAIANDYNDPAVSGTASGIVNVAGWSAAVVASLLMGATLSIIGTNPSDYRIGLLVALCIPAAGIVQMVRWWRRARRTSLSAVARGEQVPVLVQRRRWDLPLDEEPPLASRSA